MKVLAVLLGASLAALSSAKIIIDDFSTGMDSHYIKAGTEFFNQAGSMEGGNRMVQLSVIQNPNLTDLGYDITGGYASFANGPLAISRVGIGYGYTASADHKSFTKYDIHLNLMDQEAFQFVFNGNEQAMTVKISLNDDPSLTAFFVAAATPNKATYRVDLGQFNNGFVDFSHISQVAVVIDSPSSNKFKLCEIAAVPEPASMAVLGLGLAALIRKRRKLAA